MKKYRWDEILVIAVMIAAAIGILIILGTNMSVLGKAYSNLPTEQGVIEMLSQCEIKTGEGNTRCLFECGRAASTCTMAWEGETLKECDERLSGEYSCLCCTSP